eukprot:TRINITY_DN16452_c0_g1_i1.p1 TRINITY_DN16452_c0_g1~~TRINITY_DN16452_c0_g1_i1.p1  ORF type:complete len:71 (-),score=7.43 TRINITY_DN16452_c0_g1_i1:434-646(-)
MYAFADPNMVSVETYMHNKFISKAILSRLTITLNKGTERGRVVFLEMGKSEISNVSKMCQTFEAEGFLYS